MTIVETNLVPDGLASAPGLAFEAEPDSGMYRGASDEIDFAVSGAQALKIKSTGIDVGNIIEVTANCPLNADCVDQAFFIANRAYQVVGVKEVHATAGNDAGAVNLQVTKDTSTNAPGAGTDLLTDNSAAGFNLKGTANTVQTGTLTGTTASLQLAAGDRLSLDFAGTVTTLAGLQVTVQLKAI